MKGSREGENSCSIIPIGDTEKALHVGWCGISNTIWLNRSWLVTCLSYTDASAFYAFGADIYPLSPSWMNWHGRHFRKRSPDWNNYPWILSVQHLYTAQISTVFDNEFTVICGPLLFWHHLQIIQPTFYKIILWWFVVWDMNVMGTMEKECVRFPSAYDTFIRTV